MLDPGFLGHLFWRISHFFLRCSLHRMLNTARSATRNKMSSASRLSTLKPPQAPLYISDVKSYNNEVNNGDWRSW
jgi:hypothetical protein